MSCSLWACVFASLVLHPTSYILYPVSGLLSPVGSHCLPQNLTYITTISLPWDNLGGWLLLMNDTCLCPLKLFQIFVLWRMWMFPHPHNTSGWLPQRNKKNTSNLVKKETYRQWKRKRKGQKALTKCSSDEHCFFRPQGLIFLSNDGFLKTFSFIASTK